MTITEIPTDDTVTVTADTMGDSEVVVTLTGQGTGMFGSYHDGVALTGTPEQVRTALQTALNKIHTLTAPPQPDRNPVYDHVRGMSDANLRALLLNLRPGYYGLLLSAVHGLDRQGGEG